MRTGKVRSAVMIISRGLPGIRCSSFVVRSYRRMPPDLLCCPAPWAYRAARLSSGHVWPRPSFLRCERDQTRLLDPTTSAYSELLAKLERGADRSPAGGPLRHQ